MQSRVVSGNLCCTILTWTCFGFTLVVSRSHILSHRFNYLFTPNFFYIVVNVLFDSHPQFSFFLTFSALSSGFSQAVKDHIFLPGSRSPPSPLSLTIPTAQPPSLLSHFLVVSYAESRMVVSSQCISSLLLLLAKQLF